MFSILNYIIQIIKSDLMYKHEKEKVQNSKELTDDIRGTSIYKQWAKTIKENANYMCVCCGSNEKVVAHHSLSYKYYKELRLDPNNGVCLCNKCHINYHKQYNLKNTSPNTLILFIKDYLNNK